MYCKEVGLGEAQSKAIFVVGECPPPAPGMGSSGSMIQSEFTKDYMIYVN
jgi:hypothetical protein